MSRFKFKDPNTGQWVFTANKDEVDLKVDKVTGKTLTTNDYTNEEKSKVTNLPADTVSELADIDARLEESELDLTQHKSAYANKVISIDKEIYDIQRYLGKV